VGCGVLGNDEGSSDSRNIHPTNLGDNVFNVVSSNCQVNQDLNPDKIVEGRGFNQ
jgi:hypothetical protein